MKNIILFFGSFDPLHKGHISIMESAINAINADYLYLGLNKSSAKGKLTPLFHRKKMLKLISDTSPKYKVLDFCFDYNNLDLTYQKIFSLANNENNYYILVGQDQLIFLKKWYKYELLITKFKFIIAKRGDVEITKEYLDNPNYIFVDHEFKGVSSSLIKEKKYDYTYESITNYITEHNLYLKKQIKPYLDQERYLHTLSVCKTALLINKEAKLGLDKYKIERAALLHDIAKNLDKDRANYILRDYYKDYLNENEDILHQYIGEHIARENFYVYDDDTLNAIKYHTTGRANMTTLEKLIYVSDKIEPYRKYNTKPLIELCIKDFEAGFIEVLKNNKSYLENKGIKLNNQDTINCFKYYL